MIVKSVSKISKIIFILLVFKTNALSNNFLIDQDDKLFIETTNSGFKFHKNFMSQNKHNFNYYIPNYNTGVMFITDAQIN